MAINPDSIIDLLSSKSGRKPVNGNGKRYINLPRVCCGEWGPDSDGLKVTARSGELLLNCFQTPLKKREKRKHCADGISAAWGVETDDRPATDPLPRSVRGRIPKGATAVGGVQRWWYVSATGRRVAQCRQDYVLPDGTMGKELWREPAGVNSGRVQVRLYGDDGQSPVVLCEGEKAADAVAAAGLVAASYFGGTAGASKADYSSLAGRSVIIWPDDDQVGQKAAREAGLSLYPIAQSIKMVPVAGEGKGRDAADYGADDVRRIVAGAVAWEMEPLDQPGIDAPTMYLENDDRGIEAGLAMMGLEMRMNARTLSPEIRRVDHETADGQAWYKRYGLAGIGAGGWERMTDGIRDSLTFSIARRARFSNGRPAEFSSERWERIQSAYIATRRVDPVREWLGGLPRWDGVPRVETLFIDLLAADDTPLNRVAASAFMVGAVGRTMAPGCQHDWIPVLIGPQGCGKSTFAAALLPREYEHEWFSDQTDFSETPQKQVEGVASALIVEFAELKGLSYAKLDKAKSYLARRTDHIRLSYRRNAESLRRRWVGLGTANPHAGGVLPNDDTKNRRFVSIRVEPDGPAGIRAWLDVHRDQLWAEAMSMYGRGIGSHIPDELEMARDDVNAEYERQNEGLANRVEAYTVEHMGSGVGRELLMIMRDIGIVDSDKLDEARLKLFEQRQLAAALAKKAWTKRIVRRGGRASTMWFPPSGVK